MGYYSIHELEMYNVTIDHHVVDMLEEDANEILVEAYSNGECDDMAYSIGMMGADMSEAKGYGVATEIRVLARKYPNILFVYSRSGEESGDFFRGFYYGDRYYTKQIEIEWPEVDWSKLT